MVKMEEFSSFCVSCKCIGHRRGECNIQSSAPLSILKSNVDPELYIGNALDNDNIVLASAVPEERNVGIILTHEGEVGISDEFPSNEFDSTQNCVDVDLPLVNSVDMPQIAVDVLVDGLKPPGVDLEGAIVSAGCSLVVSPNSVEMAPNGCVSGDNQVDEFKDQSKVNKVVAVEASVLGNTSERSPVTILDSPLGAIKPTHFVDVPISLISNDDLKAHVASKVIDSPGDPYDWLEDASFYGGRPEVILDEPIDKSHEIYSLQVGHCVDIASSFGGGKRRRRKSKSK
ncbi:hypothetical protein M5K25_018642 [Dendrobium thyrsiflorum]|uniref:Uncharacterized protein n=1 Tax=Dendrobium thyrsiflorum TaxID=117978 RepID=A0ABD0UJ41_DENTH